MRAFSLVAALACLAVAGTAAAQDAAHSQIQAFLNVLQNGGDFASSEFRDAVKSGDAVRLRALAECDLNSVKRSEGGSSAIVLFSCPAADGRKTATAVMIMFSSGKVASIEPMSFVQVPERG